MQTAGELAGETLLILCDLDSPNSTEYIESEEKQKKRMTPTHNQFWQWFSPKKMQKLWSKIQVQKSDCWVWTGAKGDGYGITYITIDGKKIAIPVHRVMVVLFSGKDFPADSPIARHTCRNRSCCNPQHLVSGTDAENIQDSWNDATVDRRGKRNRKAWYGGCGSTPDMSIAPIAILDRQQRLKHRSASTPLHCNNMVITPQTTSYDVVAASYKALYPTVPQALVLTVTHVKLHNLYTLLLHPSLMRRVDACV